MRTNILFALVLGAATTFCACSKDGDTKTTDANPDTAAGENAKAGEEGQHAPADAEPGSHEDWCGEHAVPESQCTRCNDSLIAAFKATGDWCEDHGLPKSQCKKCNPDLEIVRPPKKE